MTEAAHLIARNFECVKDIMLLYELLIKIMYAAAILTRPNTETLG